MSSTSVPTTTTKTTTIPTTTTPPIPTTKTPIPDPSKTPIPGATTTTPIPVTTSTIPSATDTPGKLKTSYLNAKKLSDLIPFKLKITMSIIVLVFIFTSFGNMYNITFASPRFLINQMLLNFFLVIIMTFAYGIFHIYFADLPDSNFYWINKYMYIALPASIVLVLFVKNLLIYNGNMNMYCSSTETSDIQSNYNMGLVFWNCAKPVIAIVIVFIFVMLVPKFLIPFYELFDDNSQTIYFFGLGFVLALATFPAEASAYFSLQNNGCIPSSQITLIDVSGLPDPANPTTTTDTNA